MTVFTSIPTAAKLDCKPFKVAIPEQDVSDLKALLKLSRVGPATPCNSTGSHDLGVSLDWINKTKHTWENDYDWRKHESHINTFPQWKTTVPLTGPNDTYEIHFAALFSKKLDAIPLVFVHGWPGSFIEFLPILDILRGRYSEDDLPYHVVVPSIVGYGFSAAPRTTDFSYTDVAKLVDELMRGLGFSEYIAQGGDVGSGICRLLSQNHDACKAIHLNMFGASAPKDDDRLALSDEQRTALERGLSWLTTGWAYGIEQGTRPNTLGFAISSNPLSLLAWVGEKWLEWSDDTPPIDTILTDISIYWFTNTISTSFWPYRESVTRKPGFYKYHDKPTGYTWFPKEIIPMPESWIKPHANLVFYRQQKKGGHFAAVEQPTVLLQDFEDFIAQVGPDALSNYPKKS